MSFSKAGLAPALCLPLRGLGYNDPTYLASRHGVPQCAAAANLKQALAGFAQATVAK